MERIKSFISTHEVWSKIAQYDGWRIAPHKCLSSFDLLATVLDLKVMEYLDLDHVHYLPMTIQDIRIFLRSLVHTLQLAHSRNVMNRDLHTGNIYFDVKMVKLFDWDDGAIFKPNAVKLCVSRTPMKNPPEGWYNSSALHATVSGYDIWNVGIVLRKILARRDQSYINDPVDRATVSKLLNFSNATLMTDPYQRLNDPTPLNYSDIRF